MREGLVIDDIAIPAIGLSDNAESDTGWTAEGFVRASNTLPQDWKVQALLFHKDGSVSLTRMALTDNAGQMGIGLSDDLDYAILVISASTQSTTEAGTYQLEIK